jgi:hypothetical protein
VGKRRRQCRAVPGGDRRQAGQDEGEAGHGLPIGVAVAWSWGRLAGMRQGCRRRGPCWRDSNTGSSPGLRSLDRSRLPWGNDGASVEQCLVVIVGKRRQVEGNPALPWSGPLACRQSGLPGVVFRPIAGRSGCCRCHWRRSTVGSSPGLRSLDRLRPPRGDNGASVEQCLVVIAGKRARTTERQRTGSRSGLPWLVRVSGYGCAPGCRRRGSSWRRSIIGSSSGPSSARSLKAAAGRQRRRCRAVPGGDRWPAGQDDGETAHGLPIGVAVTGQGVGLQACARVAASVARAGGTRSPVVLPGLRPLNRCSLPRGDDSASVEQYRVAITGK